MSESHAASIAYHPAFLEYDFGPEHPLRPERISSGLDLLKETGLWRPSDETLAGPPAETEELELVHDPAYIRAVEEAGIAHLPRSELARYGLAPGDNPAFPNMHEAAAFVTGASIEAARQVMSGRLLHAFNPAGGLHHALAGRASGFCIYNDPAVAAAVAVKEFGARVLYLDFDCHHGDGVQWLFYDRSDVMTVSFHESGRYLFPGTGDVGERGEGAGVGYSVNLPFAPFTQDDSWLEAVHTLIPQAAERFGPDLIISSHGADTHVWDPLTHLALTTRSFVEQARLIHRLAHQLCQGRWIAVGSGGYDWRRVVPRSWSIVWAEMTQRPLPVEIPQAWRERWDGDPVAPLPSRFDDAPDTSPPVPRKAEVERINRDTLAAAMSLLAGDVRV